MKVISCFGGFYRFITVNRCTTECYCLKFPKKCVLGSKRCDMHKVLSNSATIQASRTRSATVPSSFWCTASAGVASKSH